MNKLNQKSCRECGETIRGRSDKKFCGDQCRNTYNNRCTQEANSIMRSVNCILRKNRKILEELLPGQSARISRQKLYEKGFNFEFTTSLLTTRDGTVFRFCYDFGYQFLQDEMLVLVKSSEFETLQEA